MNVGKGLRNLVRRVEIQHSGVQNIRNKLLSNSRKGGGNTDAQNCNM